MKKLLLTLFSFAVLTVLSGYVSEVRAEAAYGLSQTTFCSGTSSRASFYWSGPGQNPGAVYLDLTGIGGNSWNVTPYHSWSNIALANGASYSWLINAGWYFEDSPGSGSYWHWWPTAERNFTSVDCSPETALLTASFTNNGLYPATVTYRFLRGDGSVVSTSSMPVSGGETQFANTDDIPARGPYTVWWDPYKDRGADVRDVDCRDPLSPLAVDNGSGGGYDQQWRATITFKCYDGSQPLGGPTPTAATNLSPNGGTSGSCVSATEASVNFSWTPASGTTFTQQYQDYTVWPTTSGDQNGQPLSVGQGSTTRTMPHNTTIYWRINTQASSGTWYPSSVVSFSTPNCTPINPVNPASGLSAAAGACTSATTANVSFVWTPASGSTFDSQYHDYTVSPTTSGDQNGQSLGVGTSSVTRSLPHNTTIYWRINTHSSTTGLWYPSSVYFVNTPNCASGTPPGVVLTANGSHSLSVASGSPVTLLWNTTNTPDSCTGSGSWSGSKVTGIGSQVVTVSTNSTFTITCAKAGYSSAVDWVIVNVGVVPTPTPTPLPGSCNSTAVGTNQLVGCLWDGMNFNTADGQGPSGAIQSVPVADSATAIDQDWAYGEASPAVGSDTFSARWKGNFTFKAGTYTFYAGADDGVRLRVDGVTTVDSWIDSGYFERSASRTFGSQAVHNIEMDYYENGGAARASLRWTFVPASNQLPIGFHDGTDNPTCQTWGWAFDPDVSSQSIDVHIYRDGPAGSGIIVGGYVANTSRPDVNTAYGITGNHGFSVQFNPNTAGEAPLYNSGTHSLYVYAIDTAGGTNFLLYNSPKNIACTSPTNMTVSGLPACASGNYSATFNWTGNASGWWIDIDNDGNWDNGYLSGNGPYSGVTSVAIGGFNPGTTYYWRMWYSVANTWAYPPSGVNTPPGTPFSVPQCLDLKARFVKPLPSIPYNVGDMASVTVRVTNIGGQASAATTLGLWASPGDPAAPSCPGSPVTPPVGKSWSVPALNPGALTDLPPIIFNVGMTKGLFTANAYVIPLCGPAPNNTDADWGNNSTNGVGLVDDGQVGGFTYSVEVDSWFETTKGDVGSQSGSITVSQLAPSSPAKFNSEYLIAAGGSLGAKTKSQNNWTITNYTGHRMVPAGSIYNYMADRFRQKAISEGHVPPGNPCGISNGVLPNSKTFAYCNGDAVWDKANGAPNGTQVWFIDGNLTIKTNLTLAAGDYLIFIVKGNITVNTDVTRADGIYVAGSQFSDATSTSDERGAQLVINGSVYANSVLLNRYLGGLSCPSGDACDNSKTAADVINFQAKYIVALNSIIGSPSISWNEVAP